MANPNAVSAAIGTAKQFGKQPKVAYTKSLQTPSFGGGISSRVDYDAQKLSQALGVLGNNIMRETIAMDERKKQQLTSDEADRMIAGKTPAELDKLNKMTYLQQSNKGFDLTDNPYAMATLDQSIGSMMATSAKAQYLEESQGKLLTPEEATHLYASIMEQKKADYQDNIINDAAFDKGMFNGYLGNIESVAMDAHEKIAQEKRYEGQRTVAVAFENLGDSIKNMSPEYVGLAVQEITRRLQLFSSTPEEARKQLQAHIDQLAQYVNDEDTLAAIKAVQFDEDTTLGDVLSFAKARANVNTNILENYADAVRGTSTKDDGTLDWSKVQQSLAANGVAEGSPQYKEVMEYLEYIDSDAKRAAKQQYDELKKNTLISAYHAGSLAEGVSIIQRSGLDLEDQLTAKRNLEALTKAADDDSDPIDQYFARYKKNQGITDDFVITELMNKDERTEEEDKTLAKAITRKLRYLDRYDKEKAEALRAADQQQKHEEALELEQQIRNEQSLLDVFLDYMSDPLMHIEKAADILGEQEEHGAATTTEIPQKEEEVEESTSPSSTTTTSDNPVAQQTQPKPKPIPKVQAPKGETEDEQQILDAFTYQLNREASLDEIMANPDVYTILDKYGLDSDVIFNKLAQALKEREQTRELEVEEQEAEATPVVAEVTKETPKEEPVEVEAVEEETGDDEPSFLARMYQQAKTNLQNIYEGKEKVPFISDILSSSEAEASEPDAPVEGDVYKKPQNIKDAEAALGEKPTIDATDYTVANSSKKMKAYKKENDAYKERKAHLDNLKNLKYWGNEDKPNVGAKGDSSIVNRMREAQPYMQYKIDPSTYNGSSEQFKKYHGRAMSGHGCVAACSYALRGTPFGDIISTDEVLDKAMETGLLRDPKTYTPKAGDIIIVNHGEHAVMMSDMGGTIQNGSMGNGIWESSRHPYDMFKGRVDYVVATSKYDRKDDKK